MGRVSSDKVPLSKSFDTVETSDTLYSADLFSRHISSVLWTSEEVDEEPESSDQEPNDIETYYSPNLVPGLDNENEVEIGLVEAQKDEKVQEELQSKEGEKLVETQKDGKAQEELQSEVGENLDSSLSNYYNKLIGLTGFSSSKWREDKPFDEDSILRSEMGEGVEAVYGAGLVFDGHPHGEDKEVSSNARGGVLGGSTKNRNEDPGEKMIAVIWKEWGFDNPRKRRRNLCFILLFLLFVATVAFSIGFSRSNRRDGDANSLVKGSQQIGDNEGLNNITEFEGSPLLSPGPTISWAPTGTPQPSVSATEPPSDVPSSYFENPVDTALPTFSTMAPTEPPPPTLSPVPPPTNRPSEAKTRGPTNNPTNGPTPCTSRISVDQNCYEEPNDVIVVDFEHCDPKANDWVGLYFDGSDPKSLGDDYKEWAWSCGTKRCGDSPSSNQFGLEARGLDIGRYRVFLVTDAADGEPYQSEAMSASFIVTNRCG